MDILESLKQVTTLSDERKEELVKKHYAGTLTDEEREEIGDHIAKAIVRLERENEVAEDLAAHKAAA